MDHITKSHVALDRVCTDPRLVFLPNGGCHTCATALDQCTFFTKTTLTPLGIALPSCTATRHSVNMVGLSDQVNNAAKQTKPINGNPLPGYHIYSRSERHRNRVLPAHLTYRPEPQSLPPPSPPRQYANERSRLLHEGLRNNGHFVLNKTINDLADERRAEEVRAQKALEAEHAWHAERERKKQAEKLGATDPSVNSVGAKLQIDFQRSALLQRQLHLFQRTEPEQPTSETEQSSEPEPEQRTEADQQTRAEEQVGTEQQTETEQEVETDQPHQRAPSFDPEFDEDRGVFNNPLAELNGADPFADFDGDHTHLHGEIDYGEERGNLSDSDSDEKDEDNDSSSEEGSDQESEEDSSSEDESDRNNRFASFDGDHTHLHTPFVTYEDFEIYEDSTAGSEPEDDNSIEIELGRLPDYLQGLGLDDDQVQIFEDPEDENMDSIDEILAAAHATGYPHEDEDEDMGDDVDLDYEDGDDIGDEDEHDDMDMIPSAPFNPIAMGLKEIGGLAHFRVSSFKPGNGVDELKNDDTERYWQ